MIKKAILSLAFVFGVGGAVEAATAYYQPYASVAAIKAIGAVSPLIANVSTASYYAGGYAGGAQYSYYAICPITPDEGLAVAVTVSGSPYACWKMVENGVVTVDQYGADPTGASDTTTKMQAAFDNPGGVNLLSAPTVPATQTVTLTEGTYILSVIGAGSATSAAGTATGDNFGAASNGTKNTFTLSNPGTVSITVAGGPSAFSLNPGVPVECEGGVYKDAGLLVKKANFVFNGRGPNCRLQGTAAATYIAETSGFGSATIFHPRILFENLTLDVTSMAAGTKGLAMDYGWDVEYHNVFVAGDQSGAVDHFVFGTGVYVAKCSRCTSNNVGAVISAQALVGNPGTTLSIDNSTLIQLKLANFRIIHIGNATAFQGNKHKILIASGGTPYITTDGSVDFEGQGCLVYSGANIDAATGWEFNGNSYEAMSSNPFGAECISAPGNTYTNSAVPNSSTFNGIIQARAFLPLVGATRVGGLATFTISPGTPVGGVAQYTVPSKYEYVDIAGCGAPFNETHAMVVASNTGANTFQAYVTASGSASCSGGTARPNSWRSGRDTALFSGAIIYDQISGIIRFDKSALPVIACNSLLGGLSVDNLGAKTDTNSFDNVVGMDTLCRPTFGGSSIFGGNRLIYTKSSDDLSTTGTFDVSTGGFASGAPTGGFKGTGTVNAAAAYYANGTVGVSCSVGTLNPVTAIVSNGIITHC